MGGSSLLRSIPAALIPTALIPTALIPAALIPAAIILVALITISLILAASTRQHLTKMLQESSHLTLCCRLVKSGT